MHHRDWRCITRQHTCCDNIVQIKQTHEQRNTYANIKPNWTTTQTSMNKRKLTENPKQDRTRVHICYYQHQWTTPNWTTTQRSTNKRKLTKNLKQDRPRVHICHCQHQWTIMNECKTHVSFQFNQLHSAEPNSRAIPPIVMVAVVTPLAWPLAILVRVSPSSF